MNKKKRIKSISYVYIYTVLKRAEVSALQSILPLPSAPPPLPLPACDCTTSGLSDQMKERDCVEEVRKRL